MRGKDATQLQDEIDHLALEHQKLQETVGELSLLIDIASAINSTLSVQEVNRKVVKRCVQYMNVEQGAVHLLQFDPKDLLRSQVRVYGTQNGTERLRLNPSIIGWMLKHHSALLSNNLPSDTRFPGVDLSGEGVQSILSVPMLYRGHPIGFLTLFNKRTAEGFTSEDERLLVAIAAHCAQVIEMARLNEQELRLRAHECQLKEARRIHQQLLPQTAPDLTGVRLSGMSRPACTVGGDYYGFIPLTSGRWGIAVADVTGHGLGAALMMSDLQATLRASARLTDDAGECVAAVNWLFSQPVADDARRHASLFYAVLDSANRTLTYTNAGHNPPWLIRPDGSLMPLDTGGLMLGVLPATTYEQATVSLKSGDIALIYTDGITEGRNPDDEMYEEERLSGSAQRYRKREPDSFLAGVMEDFEQFRSGAELRDDITLVCLKAN